MVIAPVRGHRGRTGMRNLDFDGDIHAGRKVELLELIHGLGGGFDDIDQALVRALLEGFLGFLVRVGRALNGEALDAGRQRDGSGDARAGAFDGIRDVARGLVYDPVVIRPSVEYECVVQPYKEQLSVNGFCLSRLPGSGETERGI